MLDLRDIVWAGTESALNSAMAMEPMLAEKMKSGPFDFVEPSFERAGSVAMIPIKGSIVNIDNPLLAFFGVASYPGIRRALIAAAQDPEIDQILLDVHSGGGHVSGCADTADLISRISSKIKPVTAFVDGAMMSAAYWLGSSAEKVYASQTAEVGSIGVLLVHREVSKALEANGEKITVIREGEFKALASPYEKLSDKARAQIDGMMKPAYKVFGEHVAKARGVTYEKMDETMGQGRQFFGQQAMDAGLVDGITTFDALLSELQQKSIDKKKRPYDNGIHKQRSAAMAKATLTDLQIQALASGTTPEALVAEALKTLPQLSIEDQAALKVAADAEVERKAAVDKETARLAALAKADTDNQVIAYLKNEIAEKDKALLGANVKVSELGDKIASLETTHNPLADIARASVKTMQVALGGSAVDLTAMSPAALVNEHKRVAELFAAKFPTGGVAAANTAPAEDSADVSKPDVQFDAARLAAVRGTKKTS